MQAQKGFEDKNMRKSFSIVFKTEGIKGFYRFKINVQQILLGFHLNFKLFLLIKRLYSAIDGLRVLSINTILRL